MIKKLLITMLILSLFSTYGWTQEKQVSGKVTSQDDGSPIPGANIVVQGTTKGTTSDVEGNYSLQLAASENILVFSFVGFVPITITVDGRTTIDVALAPDVTALEEVVVVGYGVQREKDRSNTLKKLSAIKHNE